MPQCVVLPAAHSSPPQKWHHLITAQEAIGWYNFLLGHLSTAWLDLQPPHSRYGHCWVTQMVLKLWAVSWDLWDDRNLAKHGPQGTLQCSKEPSLRAQITAKYSTLAQPLRTIPLPTLLSQPYDWQQPWLNHEIARSAF